MREGFAGDAPLSFPEARMGPPRCGVVRLPRPRTQQSAGHAVRWLAQQPCTAFTPQWSTPQTRHPCHLLATGSSVIPDIAHYSADPSVPSAYIWVICVSGWRDTPATPLWFPWRVAGAAVGRSPRARRCRCRSGCRSDGSSCRRRSSARQASGQSGQGSCTRAASPRR